MQLPLTWRVTASTRQHFVTDPYLQSLSGGSRTDWTTRRRRRTKHDSRWPRPTRPTSLSTFFAPHSPRTCSIKPERDMTRPADETLEELLAWTKFAFRQQLVQELRKVLEDPKHLA